MTRLLRQTLLAWAQTCPPTVLKVDLPDSYHRNLWMKRLAKMGKVLVEAMGVKVRMLK